MPTLQQEERAMPKTRTHDPQREAARSSAETPPDDLENSSDPAATQPASGPSGGNGGLTRITVNLTRHAVQALDQVAEATGYSKTDTINRALQIYAIIQEMMDESGGVLQVLREDG